MLRHCQPCFLTQTSMKAITYFSATTITYNILKTNCYCYLCCGSCLISLTTCAGVWTDTDTCGGGCCCCGGGGGGGGACCCWWWYNCCNCCLAGLLCSSPSLSATVTHDMTFFRCLADNPLDGVDWALQYSKNCSLLQCNVLTFQFIIFKMINSWLLTAVYKINHTIHQKLHCRHTFFHLKTSDTQNAVCYIMSKNSHNIQSVEIC